HDLRHGAGGWKRRPRLPHRPDPLLDRGLHEAIVVLRDEPVHAALEQGAEDRIERFVGLAEVHPGAAVPEVLEPRPTGGTGPQRLADRVVAPRLVRPHLGEPLPRPAGAAGQEVARDRKVTVAGAAFAGRPTPLHGP